MFCTNAMFIPILVLYRFNGRVYGVVILRAQIKINAFDRLGRVCCNASDVWSWLMTNVRSILFGGSAYFNSVLHRTRPKHAVTILQRCSSRPRAYYPEPNNVHARLFFGSATVNYSRTGSSRNRGHACPSEINYSIVTNVRVRRFAAFATRALCLYSVPNYARVSRAIPPPKQWQGDNCLRVSHLLPPPIEKSHTSKQSKTKIYLFFIFTFKL